jgi:hypothetical protein
MVGVGVEARTDGLGVSEQPASTSVPITHVVAILVSVVRLVPLHALVPYIAAPISWQTITPMQQNLNLRSPSFDNDRSQPNNGTQHNTGLCPL